MKEKFKFEVMNGKEGVRFECDGYTTQILTTQNGCQWAGATISKSNALAIIKLLTANGHMIQEDRYD